MTVIEALERHIPSVREHLADAVPTAHSPVLWKESGADFLCAFGVQGSFYAQVRPWLDGNAARRLVFVEDRPGSLALLLQDQDAIFLLNDARVKLYFIDTPLQIEPLAKKIAWSAVFLKMEIFDLSHSPLFASFCQIAQKTHLAADLLLSDGADWGCQSIRHAKRNFWRPCRSALSLSFPNIPAVIVGAGHSLQTQRPILKTLRSCALILAGGSALDLFNFPPHFAASVDKEKSPKQKPFSKTPLCFQARTHPQHLLSAKGETLLIPDGHFAFLNWLMGDPTLFDGGWTVGTTLTALAVQWGCNPIVWVGMDFCYSGQKKYAEGPDTPLTGCIETVNAQGKCVWTQRDWLMAVQWAEAFAERHPDRCFLNATVEGLRCFSPTSLHDLHWPEIPDLATRVVEAIQRAPLFPRPRWDEWKQSLQRCADHCAALLREENPPLEQEIAYSQLLFPLWSLWKPAIERQLDLDPHPEKMRLNEILFYQQVIQEHLDALR